MTGSSRLARAARLGAVLAAPLLALAAAPVAAQTQTATITSNPANQVHYVAGETIRAQVTISAGIISVSGGTFAEARMSLDIGGVTRQARPMEAITNPVGQLYVVFIYTVVADDFDTDGVSIPATAISGPTWGDSGGNLIDRNNAALPALALHKVVGSAASISSTTPALLHENNLDTATVDVALTGVTFGSGVAASSFELVTTMTGVTINSVSSVSSGDASATLTLASTADISAAADLAVRVLAAAHSGGTALTTAAVNVAPVSTLDAGPGITAGSLSVAVAEGASGHWNVEVSTDPGATCTAGVTISVASDNPAVTVSPATLTFTTANWNTEQTVTATAAEDDDNVVDETATVSHTVTAPCTGSGYTTALAITSVTVTVDDDDTALFAIDSPRVAEGGAGDTPTLDFTVTLSPAASAQATVNYTSGRFGDTAQQDSDYTGTRGSLTFAPGETSKTIPMTVMGDATAEPDETTTMTLSGPAPSGFVIATGMELGTGTIVDDDVPTLTIDSPRAAEGNAGTTELAFTVTLSPAAAAQVTVDWADAGGGTASSGSDYTALAGGTLTFATGETSKTIAVAMQGDETIEPDETVRVRIDNAAITSGTVRVRGADGVVAANAIGVGTIADDDAPEPVEPPEPLDPDPADPADPDPRNPDPSGPNRSPEVVDAPDAVALGSGEMATIALAGAFRDPDGDPLTLSATSSRPAVATVRLDGRTLTVSAVAEGQAQITVQASDPYGATATLSFLVTVGNPVSISGSDDAGGAGDAAAASAPEGGVAELAVAMAEPRDEDVSFAYSFGPDGNPATADADAADHGGEGGTVTIVAGETEATIRIPIADDDDIEPAREAFVVELQPSDGAGLASASAVVHVEEGVCDRTWQVADALRGGRACAAVTPADLERRRVVRLTDAGLAELDPLDFHGLAGLRVLILDGNGLSALPAGLLAGSPGLRVLRLRDNRFETLPMLGNAPALIELDVAGNLLTELPANPFENLPALGYLYLGGNGIEALPADLFADAAGLRFLELQDNALESLPAGIFAGVARLFSLQLQDNPGAPFSLPVELALVEAEAEGEGEDGDAGEDGSEDEEEPGRATIELRMPHAAPFAVSAELSAPGATLSAQMATIAAGETLGDAVSVARNAAGNEADAAVTVEITSVPNLPATACGDEYDEYRCFRGFGLEAGSPLTLFEPPAAAATATADVPTMR